MANGETTIQLSVGLDASDVKKSASELKNKIDNVFQKTKGTQVSKELEKIQLNMDKAATRAESLRNKMAELERAKVPTEDYKQLSSYADKLRGQLGQLTEKQIQMQEAGTTTGKVWDGLKTKISMVNAELENAVEEMAQMRTDGTAFTSKIDTSQYANLKNQLSGVNNQMRILYEAALNTGEIEVDSAKRTGTEWEKTGGLIKQTFKDVLSGKIFEDIGNAGVNAALRIQDAFKKLHLGNEIGKAFKSTIKLVESLTSKLKGLFFQARSGKGSFSGLNNSFQNFHATLKKGIWTILKYGLGIRSLFVLFRKLKAAVKEGLQAIALMNGGNNSANQSISALISSLNYLKASLGAAFAPILSVVAPILSAFMDMLARAAQTVGAFFAALTGKSTYIAVTKQHTNYAASVAKSSAKTNKDTKETKKNTKARKDNAKAIKDQKDKLADFDDLNVLNLETLDDLNEALDDEPEIKLPEYKAPSGGAGGAGLAGLDEKQIPDWIKNLVDKIKEAWKNADFTEIGRIVGEKMRDALNQASEWLVNVAQPFAYKLGKSIATFLNGFFETPGLATALGKTIGEMINTALIGVSAFLDNTHFRSIGQFIGDAIMSALQTVDFSKMGHILAQQFNALFQILGGIADTWDPKVFAKSLTDFVNTAIADFKASESGKALSDFAKDLLESIRLSLEGVDWKGLGTDIANFLNAIDWQGLAKELSGSINAFVDGIKTLIKTVVDETDWGEIFKGIGTLISETDLGPVEIILGALIIKNIGSVVFGALAKEALSTGAKTVLESLSGSGVLAGISKALGGIGVLLSGLVIAIKSFFDQWNNGFSVGKQLLMALGIALAAVGAIILGAPALIAAVVASIIGLVASAAILIKNHWKDIVEFFKTLVEKIKELFGDLKDKAIEIWTNLRTKVVEVVTNLRNSVETHITNLKTKAIDLFTNLKTKAIEIWTAIKSKVSDLMDKLRDALVGPSGIITKIKTLAISIFTALSSKASEIWNKIKSMIHDAAKSMYEKTVGSNGFIAKLKTKFIEIMNGLKEGIKTPINAILGFFERLANGVIDGINKMIDALNKLSFDVPEWLPEIGGKSFGFNLTRLDKISIPQLAEGAVIPPNKEFLAVLGDQKQGTNVETPLSTIQDALRNVMNERPVTNSTQNATMTLDGQTFARLVVPYVMDELNRRGYNVKVLEA